jgi:hypothetical protein
VRWSKRGLLFEPPANLAWARSHAALPIVDPVGDTLVKLYFSSRDERNRAQIGVALVDLKETGTVHEINPEPVVRLGPRGAFDDSGVTGGCLVVNGGTRYLYYSGWSLGQEVPFQFFIGCAVSTDGGRGFEKTSPAPVLGRNRFDPFLTASPSVLIEGGTWRMWYVSGTGWGEGAAREPNYRVCYAESTDGISWKPEGRVCIDYSYPGEHAIARPHVIRDGSLYRMWYSHRGQSYRLGYAESADGLQWSRKDSEVGIDVSREGWDSEMIAYAWVGDVAGERRMLYNGNGYGRTGIGQAVLEEG